MGRVTGWVLVLAGALAGGPVGAQEVSGDDAEALRIFFDCQGSGCWDLDYFRREVPFVAWVRDRESSDVHVLVTSQTTGGGGRRFVLDFIGRGAFEGRGQQVEAATAGDATTDEVRRVLVNRLRLGLGPYLAGTPLADRLRVVTEGPTSGAATGGAVPPAHDPWNHWVFTVRGNAWLNGESSYTSSNYNTSLSANRTTEAWKISATARYSRNGQSFDLDDTTTVTSTREDWSASGLLVRSVDERFSLGVRTGAGRSTYLNEDFRWNVAAGAELNVFPYRESSRRSLTFQALLDARHFDYATETIFGETAETRLAASAHANLQFVQPWGNASVNFNHSRYLHDTSKWLASVGGYFEVRLFKGFSVNMNGSYGWVRDQLYISASGATDEEILLRQRSLSTAFRYYTSFGISYRFGSIFNNVVNPRFGGGDGSFIIF